MRIVILVRTRSLKCCAPTRHTVTMTGFFACAQGVLFVVMMITILAALPAEAERAGSSASSRTHSTPTYAASRRINATAQAEVQRLLRLMDKDKNGAVSKDAFMEYMSQTFDRLDVNRSGQLERNELSKAEFPFGKGTVQQQRLTFDSWWSILHRPALVKSAFCRCRAATASALPEARRCRTATASALLEVRGQTWAQP
jgi:hypothetical protein